MRKDRRAQIATLAVLLVAMGIGVARKTGWRLSPSATRQIPAGQNPEDTIYSMLDAARAGDVKAYLASYTGALQATLLQTIAESSEAGFAKYLRDSNAGIKGVAVSDPQKIADLESRVRVEYIYQDRNEVQIMYLDKGAKGWRISRVDGEERAKTLIPYGTPVKQ